MSNPEGRPTVAIVLARTFAIAQVNFLPMAVVEAIMLVPVVFLERTNLGHTLIEAIGSEAIRRPLQIGLGAALCIFLFYGALASAHGKRVGFRECLVKGVLLAPSAMIPVFILGAAVGATDRVHVALSFALAMLLSMVPVVLVVERGNWLTAIWRALRFVIGYPWLVLASLIVFSSFDWMLAYLADEQQELYNSSLGQFLYSMASLIYVCVSVLVTCATVVLYATIRQDRDGIPPADSLPRPD